MEFNQFEKQEMELREKPNNNMVLSIVSTVLGMCSIWCIGLVLGIIAIVMSSQSTSKFNNGEYDASVKAAKNAKILALIAIGIAVLTWIYAAYSITQEGGLDVIYESFMEGYNAGRNQ